MIIIENLTKKYDKTIALNNVSMKIPMGKITVVLGPSGSGKTTLLRIIAGLEKPDTGKIIVDGEDILLKPPWERGVSMVFQTPSLFPHMTVYDNIAFGLEARTMSRKEIEEKVKWAANLLHIDHLLEKYPEQLSGGEQQRVALARALVVEPKILLLDEPLSNLDLALREELRYELKNIQRRTGITFIHVTHDQDEALELADHLIVLYKGRKVEEGPPRRVYEYPETIEAAKVFGHNIIRAYCNDEEITYPWSKDLVETNCTLIIPQHKIIISGKDNCVIIDKIYRRNYGLLIIKCKETILRTVVLLRELDNYVIGEKIGIKIIDPKIMRK